MNRRANTCLHVFLHECGSIAMTAYNWPEPLETPPADIACNVVPLIFIRQELPVEGSQNFLYGLHQKFN